jgi:hypothetical protein
VTSGYPEPWQIFTVHEEDILKSYVMRSSDVMFGLTPKEVRTPAYLCAVKNIRIPPSWTEKGIAGAD